MVDCLTLLRTFNINRREIVERDDYIIFDQAAFPRSAKTNYQIFKVGADNTPKDYYTLETLLFLLKHASLGHSAYLTQANNAKIPPIRFPDRKSLQSYLNGDIDSAPGLDRNGPLEMSVPPPSLKRTAAVAGNRHEEEQQNRKKRPPRIDPPKIPMITKDQIKGSGLGTTMPEEKIFEIKTKRIRKKRTTIQAADDLGTGLYKDNEFGDVEADTTRDIMGRERLLRNRSTILDSSGLTFTNILSVLSKIKGIEEGRINDYPPQPKQTTHHSNKPSGAYSRYDQEQYKPTKDVSVFNIDTTGTYRIQKGVSGDVPRGPTVGPQGKFEEDRHSGSKRESRTPIIIVPAALTSVLTLQNAKEFLQEERYVLNSDQGAQTVGDILIQRRKVETPNSKSYTVPYRVIDSPGKLRASDWARVVAVFVAGQQWQFKGWPGLSSDGSPVELFVKIRAFHLKFLESPLEANIKKWNVTVLEISKTKRHLDKVAVNKFWEVTDRSPPSKVALSKFKV